MLVLDTETTVDAAQTLLFGCARVYRLDRQGFALLREVLFYADDLADVDPEGFRLLVAYAAREGLQLLSRREFVDDVVWRVGFKGRAWIVGFNLPFDLARLAISWGTARGSGSGAFSLTLWDYQAEDGSRRENGYRPRIRVETIDSKRALIRFTRTREPDTVDLIPDDSEDAQPDPAYTFQGHFLDLRTLAFALTNRGHTLDSACKTFKVKHGKTKPPRHGVISRKLIAYCRRDVLATAELCERMIEAYERHPIGLPPTLARSPAAIAKAYLDAMRITPPLEQNANFPRKRLGLAMSGYFGGRAECRIRRFPVPVVLVDFLSMYPTVNALLGLSRFLTATRIEVVDATEETRRFLEHVTADDLFKPQTWRQLAVLCTVRPDGEILPSRAGYQSGGWQIGVNPLTSRKPLSYPLADLVAAKLLGGRVPEILEAWRPEPIGLQEGLRPVRLRGEVEIDPRRDDIFRRVIEERKRLEQRGNLDQEERALLDETLKVIANSGSYGITAEMTRHELGSRREEITVWSLAEPFTQKLGAVEEPGRYSFPPLAAIITAAARLMLALLEHCVTELGGGYAYGDTDSLAIVATRGGGPITFPNGGRQIALSYRQVDRIAERFKRLSPYDPHSIPGSILKVEKINFNEHGQRQQLLAYAISAKRYCLYTLDESGYPQVTKASEHGLGHLLNPTDPDSDDRDWINEVWRLIICQALELPCEEPDWLDRPALSKLAITSPALLKPFADYNRGRPSREHVRPSSFLLTAQVAPFSHPQGAEANRLRLIAPYEPDPRRWHNLPWRNLYDSVVYPVAFEGDPSPDYIRVKTYRDVIGLHATQSEPKSNGADGKPCRRETVGLLCRRPVTMSTLSLIGKESNRLEERTGGLIGSLDDVLSTYQAGQEAWKELVLPTIGDLPTDVLVERSGLDARTIQRLRARQTCPRAQHRAALVLIAADLIGELMAGAGIVVPEDPAARLALYVDKRERLSRRCPECGRPPISSRAVYCSSTCKKRGYRKRRRRQPGSEADGADGASGSTP